jgi:hypothetical protein
VHHMQIVQLEGRKDERKKGKEKREIKKEK